eukprot:TRINITY_DN6171_c0_g1_i1.p1 TRINITY_DN6171_c0_g1~~TRINITY_DN6171_c0_g1_i1.p1  ORF type:complete len:208 (+),score=38.20 TRINITY_DN6171_c0_g1_i1:26-649(+)
MAMTRNVADDLGDFRCSAVEGPESAVPLPSKLVSSDDLQMAELIKKAFRVINESPFEPSSSLQMPSMSTSVATGQEAERSATSIAKGATPIASDDEPSTSQPLEVPEGATTLMLRNIPCSLSVTKVHEELASLGFEGTYDLLHIPTRPNASCKGYGFINFVTSEDAQRFANVFVDYRFNCAKTQKRSHVTLARLQGYDANCKQFRLQ